MKLAEKLAAENASALEAVTEKQYERVIDLIKERHTATCGTRANFAGLTLEEELTLEVIKKLESEGFTVEEDHEEDAYGDVVVIATHIKWS